MNLVFIVTSFWSYGELLIALEFAKGLSSGKFNISFIVPPGHKDLVIRNHYRAIPLVPKSAQLNRLIFHELAYSIKPDLIILSDFLNYNFAHRHYGIERKDLDVFKAPIASFDNFYWSYPREAMDTYGFRSSLPNKVDIGLYGARIIPCPLVNPDMVEEEGLYTYSLVEDFIDISSKAEKRLEYGFDSEDKIILVSYAQWQNDHIEDESVKEFIELSNNLFSSFIGKLAENYQVICVGACGKLWGENLNISYYQSLEPRDFDKLASISDIYISRNMTSTSMVRIALSGIRCINIINSMDDRGDMEEFLEDEGLSSKIRPYKYLMFPVGWYDFLYPIFENNPYTELIDLIEQFDLDRGLELIKAILSEGGHEHMRKVDQLKERLSSLMAGEEIIASILANDLGGGN